MAVIFVNIVVNGLTNITVDFFCNKEILFTEKLSSIIFELHVFQELSVSDLISNRI